jgi:hypothetical protein
MRQPHHDPQGRLRFLYRLRRGRHLRLTAARFKQNAPEKPGRFLFVVPELRI